MKRLIGGLGVGLLAMGIGVGVGAWADGPGHGPGGGAGGGGCGGCEQAGCGGGGQGGCDEDAGCGGAEAIPEAVPGELTDAERADLLRMWDEEKLAHDVYVALGEVYPMRVFENIPRAEVRHRALAGVLVQRYGVAETQGEAAEVFVTEAMAGSYEQLVEQGRPSATEALRVGALIEEMDIADLRTAAARTERADLLAVYAQLERGSQNHLRAFVRNLGRRGETYVPVHLSQADFDAIVQAD